MDLPHVPDDDCCAASEDIHTQQPQGGPGHMRGVLQHHHHYHYYYHSIIIITWALADPNRNGGWTTKTIPEIVSMRFTRLEMIMEFFLKLDISNHY